MQIRGNLGVFSHAGPGDPRVVGAPDLGPDDVAVASPRGFMETDDVAKAIAFLASDDAAASHGAVYRVDNGKGAG